MSFNIFAAGSTNFHYKKEGCIDKDTFETIKILEKLQTMEPTKMGAVTTGIDYVQPSAGVSDGVEALATMEFLHNLSNAVSFLAMCSGSANGWIFISSRKSRFYWTDLTSNAKYDFSPGDSPGTEFIRRVAPSLKEADMNNWGVLLQLSIVLSKYYDHIGQSGRPIINISLDK